MGRRRTVSGVLEWQSALPGKNTVHHGDARFTICMLSFLTLPLVLATASAARVGIGAVITLIGVATLLFNRRWTEAAVAAQREGVGSLLGQQRATSDRIHTSRPFLSAARIFTAAVSVFFIVGGIAMMLTAGK